MRRVVDGNPTQTSVHGQRTNTGHFGKHLGYDYFVPKGTPVKAPVAGKVTFSGWSDTLGNWIELAGVDGRTHRLAHLSRRDASVNQQVGEGLQLGLSGNTGVVTGANGGFHVHHDVRKAGITWNASFDNYVDWEKLIAPAPSSGMPTAFRVKLAEPGKPPITFRVYEPGTTNVRGTIDHSWGWYEIRGTDPKYPNRWLINSEKYGKPTAFPFANVAGQSYLHELETK